MKKTKITKELAKQIVDDYFNCKNKSDVSRRFHLSLGYGVDKALYITGHENYCSKSFLRDYADKKGKNTKALPLISSKDTTYEEWYKASTELLLELLSRSERCLQAEAKAAEAETKYTQIKIINEELLEKVKSQGDVIQRLGRELHASNEQKVRWEVIAKGAMAEPGR